MRKSTRARPSSPEQLRPSNADIFLLLLNNTSRSHRKDFERQVNRRSRTIAHRFDPDLIPSKDPSEMTHRSEVVFMRTASKVIAPFTLFTIPLTEQMSALVLVEVSASTNLCSLVIALVSVGEQFDLLEFVRTHPSSRLVHQSWRLSLHEIESTDQVGRIERRCSTLCKNPALTSTRRTGLLFA